MSEFNFNASFDLTELINVLNQEYDFTRITDEVLDEIDYDQIKSDVLSDIDYDQIKNDVIEDIDTDEIANIVKSEIDYDSIIDDVKSNLDYGDIWYEIEGYATGAFSDATMTEIESLLDSYVPGNGCRTGNLFTSAVNEAIRFLLKDDLELFSLIGNAEVEEDETVEEFAPPAVPEIPTELVNLYTRPDVLTIVDEVARRVSDRTGSATQYELRVMMQDAVIAILNERGNNA